MNPSEREMSADCLLIGCDSASLSIVIAVLFTPSCQIEQLELSEASKNFFLVFVSIYAPLLICFQCERKSQALFHSASSILSALFFQKNI